MRSDPADLLNLKTRLTTRIMNRQLYPEKLTVSACLARAAELAGQVLDELINRIPPAPTRKKRQPGQGRPDDARRLAANEKRERILKVLRQSGGPVRMGEIGRRAMLTPGECSYLLKSTPVVVPVGGGKYTLKPADSI